MYKLKNINGRVNSLLKTDNAHTVRNTISISAAQHIIDNGNIVESDRPDYPICVDGQWYFEGEEISEVKETEEVETASPVKNRRKQK